jgi:hypothetical protein
LLGRIRTYEDDACASLPENASPTHWAQPTDAHADTTTERTEDIDKDPTATADDDAATSNHPQEPE